MCCGAWTRCWSAARWTRCWGCCCLQYPGWKLGGLYLKAPVALERLRHNSVRWPSTLPTVVWMAHLVLNIMLFAGLACFGVASGDDPPVWGVLLMAVVVLKELFFLLYWILKVEPAQEEPTRRSPYPARPWWSELVGDLLLLPFALLSFSCLWQMLVARNPIHYSSPGDAVVELALAVFVFLLLFAASRSLYVIEEWANPARQVAHRRLGPQHLAQPGPGGGILADGLTHPAKFMPLETAFPRRSTRRLLILQSVLGVFFFLVRPVPVCANPAAVRPQQNR